MTCLICKAPAVYGDLCADCFVGLQRFKKSTKLLGRAIAYIGKKAKLVTKHQRRIERRRRSDISRLVAEQREDERI